MGPPLIKDHETATPSLTSHTSQQVHKERTLAWLGVRSRETEKDSCLMSCVGREKKNKIMLHKDIRFPDALSC